MYTPLTPGTLLHNRYQLIAVAEQGNFGQTYLASDQKRANGLCVLKEFIPAQPEPTHLQTQWRRCHQAAAALYDLKHPQLPSFQVMILEGDRFYWVREYIEGQSYGILLDARKAAGQVFSEAEVVQFLQQVLPVLNYLHSHDVVHQNLSLDSIILRTADQLPVLINFGLVKELAVRLQLHPVESTLASGKWGYMPPEQLAKGTVTPSGDLYALAAIALALLTGKEPSELYDQAAQVFNWEHWVVVNPKFGRILRQMLHPNPKKRFASTTQVLRAVKALTSNFQPTATATNNAPKPATQQPPQASESHSPRQRLVKKRKLLRQRFQPLSGESMASIALVIGLALLVVVLTWRVLSSILTATQPRSPSPELTTSAPLPAPGASPNSTLTQPSLQPPANQDALRDRRQKLGIDLSFFTVLVDEVFYTRYPQLKNSATTLSDSDRSKFQAEWNGLAGNLMDKLESISPDNRSKLGSYRRVDYEQWLKALGESGPSSRTLDSLADNRFFQLFPDQQGKALNPRTFGQIWYAIAADQLEAAKAQKTTSPAPVSPIPAQTANRDRRP